MKPTAHAVSGVCGPYQLRNDITDLQEPLLASQECMMNKSYCQMVFISVSPAWSLTTNFVLEVGPLLLPVHFHVLAVFIIIISFIFPSVLNLPYVSLLVSLCVISTKLKQSALSCMTVILLLAHRSCTCSHVAIMPLLALLTYTTHEVNPEL